MLPLQSNRIGTPVQGCTAAQSVTKCHGGISHCMCRLALPPGERVPVRISSPVAVIAAAVKQITTHDLYTISTIDTNDEHQDTKTFQAWKISL